MKMSNRSCQSDDLLSNILYKKAILVDGNYGTIKPSYVFWANKACDICFECHHKGADLCVTVVESYVDDVFDKGDWV